jgi:tetratricopeptide (TPR) repeat protein
MAVFADSLTSLPPQEQRDPFRLHARNFHVALAESERLGMKEEEKALAQSLAVWARNNRDFAEADRLFRHDDMAAVAYHELGTIALEQRDLDSANRWYEKALAIWERQRNENDASITCHQLGRVAEESQDLPIAERWYRRSLAIVENQGNDLAAAISYERLGSLAKQQRDFVAAEQWYRKSIAIRENAGRTTPPL